jgi:hypothetical protein
LRESNDTEPGTLAKPRDLTLFFGVAQSHPFAGRGLDRLAEPGLSLPPWPNGGSVNA